MRDALAGLSLVDLSGYLIISTIIAFLIAGILVTLLLRGRYARIERDLEQHAGPTPRFESSVLNRIVASARETIRRHPGDINTQAIIDDNFQSELKWLLIGERFVKASTGLMIILGLVGTFYGLTLSIGKLVALISGEMSDTTEIAEALTQGLTRALSGMSVAFSTSLFGILAAIVMTLLGVFANVTDRRVAIMVKIEAFVDNVLLNAIRVGGGEAGAGAGQGYGHAAGAAPVDAGVLAQRVEEFGQSVAQLHAAVGQFESALQTFSTTTRDFREFNLHLKDNVQRMSLSFGDLSETLKAQVRALNHRDPS
jgi:hypothetical protein